MVVEISGVFRPYIFQFESELEREDKREIEGGESVIELTRCGGDVFGPAIVAGLRKVR